MIYRLAANEDLDQMMAMVDQAKASFKARASTSGRRGAGPRGPGRRRSKGTDRVLEEDGRVIGMITLLEGRDPSYAKIDGAWLNITAPMWASTASAWRRAKGAALPPGSFPSPRLTAAASGMISASTPPDNRSMQRALTKAATGPRIDPSVGRLEDGELRIAYQKTLQARSQKN